MAKMKNEINYNPKPMVYACILENLRRIAANCGYALAVHGSLVRDLDLIAVRWNLNYEHPDYLCKAFLEELSKYSFGEEIERNFVEITKPEIRYVNQYHYSIPITSDWYIDLTVIKGWEDKE